VSAVTGDNGTFTDHCDEDGNLVEYVCEETMSCGPDFCEPFVTGQVIEQAIDCKGTCLSGACDLGCPDEGIEVSIAAVDAAGVTTLNDAASGTNYTCASVIDEGSNDAWDCAGPQAVGAKGTVGIVSQGKFCTEGEGSFGVAFSAGDCFYLNCARSN
jgi:hypothetical protein